VLIYGAGSHAKVVIDTTRALGFEVVGYLIAWRRFVEQGGARWPEAPVALAIGDHAGRARLQAAAQRWSAAHHTRSPESRCLSFG
jgi:hypothetical protein